VGRLSPEKGVRTLLEAWKILGEGGMPLKILGDGPLADEVARTADENPRVEWLGYKPSHQVRDHMREAAALIFPSEWYETFGRVAVEAFASGTPVIVSDIGAISGLVEHRRTGLHFRPGEPGSLAEQVRWISAHPAERSRMRREARSEYESKYTADRNYGLLLAIYERAIDSP
jgi:glycosyltransferase involved in cell wall biosynthesis